MQRIADPDDLLGKAYDRRIATRLIGQVRPYRGQAYIALFLVVLTTGLELSIPYLFGLAVDIVSGEARGSLFGLTGSRALNWLAVLFVAILVLRFISRNRELYLMSSIGQKIVLDLRAAMFRHIQRVGVRYIDKRGVGSIMSRLQNDVSVIDQLFADGLVEILSQFAILIGIIILMWITNPQLALVAFAVLPFMVVLMVFWRRRAVVTYRQTRLTIARVNGFLAENIAGVRVIQSFTREPRNRTQFHLINDDNLEANLGAARLSSILFPFVTFIEALATALVLYFGGRMVLGADAFTVGELVTFVAYIGRFYEPINHLSQGYNTMQAAMAAGERIYTILDTEVEIEDKPGALDLPRVIGRVEFDHVRFGYDDIEVIHDVSLDVSPGESIAFVGETGAGKTSMISLLARFYDVSSGAIRIDGYDLRDVTQRSLRSQLGVVLQDTFLFAGTIRENIRFARPDATDAEMIAAATAVGAHEFVMQLPGGYDAEVHERGATLSVGQRQLLSFARALIADPRIIVLDEATSSVDTETELVIQAALRRLLAGRTSFIIAHRLSTIREASRVVVMDQGRIVEVGSHEHLLDQRGLYFNLYTMQFRATQRDAAD
ncbi:MAG TPA: ABC transporter ATP-binding protein [Thermomicrobiales bacterium]|nr:ABC transporter ATP-binding protein [Thermomicrobiales bacterium]